MPESISLSALKCFISLTHNVSTITTQSVLQSTFNFLETGGKKGYWDHPLPIALFKSMSAKNNHLVVSEIVKNIEDPRQQTHKERILNALRVWLSEEKGERKVFQPAIEVLSPLARIIEAPPEKRKIEKGKSEKNKLVEAASECCFHIASGIKQFSERVEAASFFLRKAQESKHKKVRLLEVCLRVKEFDASYFLTSFNFSFLFENISFRLSPLSLTLTLILHFHPNFWILSRISPTHNPELSLSRFIKKL